MRTRFGLAGVLSLVLAVVAAWAGGTLDEHGVRWLDLPIVFLLALFAVLGLYCLAFAVLPMRAEFRGARSSSGTRTGAEFLGRMLLIVRKPNPERDQAEWAAGQVLRVAAGFRTGPGTRFNPGFIRLEHGAENPLVWVPRMRSMESWALPIGDEPALDDTAPGLVVGVGWKVRKMTIPTRPGDGREEDMLLAVPAVDVGLVVRAFHEAAASVGAVSD